MGAIFWVASATLLCTILWKISCIARFYLKMLLFTVMSLIFATAPIPVMILNPRNSKNALIPAAGLRFSSKLIGLKQIVHGKENVVEDSGCIVLINHQSILDLIVLAELWPLMKNSCVISKKEIFYLWPFGLACWLWGTIFIDRLNHAKALVEINKIGKDIRSHKRRILMFPEGTRSMADELLKFKKGAFHLAVSSQCPIQPVVVKKYSFLGSKKFENGEISISILPPIPTKGLCHDDIPELMSRTYKTMNNIYTAKDFK